MIEFPFNRSPLLLFLLALLHQPGETILHRLICSPNPNVVKQHAKSGVAGDEVENHRQGQTGFKPHSGSGSPATCGGRFAETMAENRFWHRVDSLGVSSLLFAARDMERPTKKPWLPEQRNNQGCCR